MMFSDHRVSREVRDGYTEWFHDGIYSNLKRLIEQYSELLSVSSFKKVELPKLSAPANAQSMDVFVWLTYRMPTVLSAAAEATIGCAKWRPSHTGANSEGRLHWHNGVDDGSRNGPI